MISFTAPQLELRVLVSRAEQLAAALPPGASHAEMNDHRAVILGELLDAIDRIDRGAGTRLHLAMHPKANALTSCDRRAA